MVKQLGLHYKVPEISAWYFGFVVFYPEMFKFFLTMQLRQPTSRVIANRHISCEQIAARLI